MDDKLAMNVVVDTSTPSGKAWVASMGGRNAWYSTPYIDVSNGLSERANVRYASVSTFGRSEEYKTFLGVTNREFTLSLHYVAGETGELNNSTDTPSVIKSSVIYPALWFENLKYPTVGTDGAGQPPPPVFLVVGNLINMRAIITACNIDWQGPYHLHTASRAGSDASSLGGGDFLPHAARVTVTFTSVSRNPGGAFYPDHHDHRGGAAPRPGMDN